MKDDKSEKISISLPQSLLAAVDAHEPNRSRYVQRLVTADLQAAGKLPGSPLAEVAELAKEAAEVVGAEVVLVALRQLGAGKLAKVGEEAA